MIYFGPFMPFAASVPGPHRTHRAGRVRGFRPPKTRAPLVESVNPKPGNQFAPPLRRSRSAGSRPPHRPRPAGAPATADRASRGQRRRRHQAFYAIGGGPDGGGLSRLPAPGAVAALAAGAAAPAARCRPTAPDPHQTKGQAAPARPQVSVRLPRCRHTFAMPDDPDRGAGR